MTWENTVLGDISLSIQTGPFGSQLHQSDYSDNGTPVVMPKDLIGGKVVIDSIARVPAIHIERLCQHKINPNDILYSRRGDVGRCAFATDKEAGWLCGTGCLRVTIDKNKANPKFVFYQLQTSESIGWVEKHAVGSTMLNLNTSILSHVPIILPDKKIQDKIADILSAYDDLVENNQKQIKLLEEAAQRLYKEWFVDFRFPGHETTLIIDGLPEGWKRVKLEQVIEKITTGLNPRKNFILGQGNNYYVTIKNMHENTIFLDEKCDKIDDDAIQKINSRSDLMQGDILFSGIGTMGRVYLISIPTTNWNVSESVFTMRANKYITKEYLYMVLLSNDMQDYCDKNAHGVAQRGIRMADLKAYKLLLPEQNCLESFTRMLLPLIGKTQSLQSQNRELAESRDRLLPKLMSGEMKL